MTMQVLTDVLMWCTILNGGLLIVSWVVCAFAGNWVYSMHSKWFPMPRETFNVVIYTFLGVYKILFWVFFAIPFIALKICGG